MNTEPLDIHDEAEERLGRAKNQERDVMAASPEAPTQACDDGPRHQSQDAETEDVVSVSHCAAADCSRRKKMAE